MASNLPTQSETCLDIFKCPICTECFFTQPIQLECSHLFCYECLQKLMEKTPLSCPVCRQETLLGMNSINCQITDLLSIAIDLQKMYLDEEQGEQQPVLEDIPKCSKHTKHYIIMFCDTCTMLICTMCFVDHQTHYLVDINKALHKCKQHATELVSTVRQSIETFNIANQEIDLSRKKLDSMFAATTEKISKQADDEIAKEIARIREEKHKVMQKAEQNYKDRVSSMETARAKNSHNMIKARHKLYEVNQLVHKGSQFKIVHHTKQLLQDLKEYTEMKAMKVPDNLSNMVLEGQKSLGIQVLKYFKQKKWNLQSKKEIFMDKQQQIVRFSPLDVAAYSNSDIVVSDWDSPSLISVSAESNPQSTFIPQALAIKGLTDPRKVTVNKNDELIVLDSQGVKIFNKNYRLLHHFTPGTSGSNPSCIAVYDNTLIAVGYYNKNEITLHKPDGSLIKTLPAPGKGGYLCASKGRLIYITCDASKLVSVNYQDDEVLSETNLPGKPHSVCSDKDGCIYLAVWKNHGSSGEIHQYSPDSNYIACIINDCPNPWGMTFTPAGDLVVAADKSVHIYRHE